MDKQMGLGNCWVARDGLYSLGVLVHPGWQPRAILDSQDLPLGEVSSAGGLPAEGRSLVEWF